MLAVVVVVVVVVAVIVVALATAAAASAAGVATPVQAPGHGNTPVEDLCLETYDTKLKAKP